MAYRWTSPHDWLGDKVNEWSAAAKAGLSGGNQQEAQDAITELHILANMVVNGTLDVDGDTIQDHYQTQMDADGYFADEDASEDEAPENDDGGVEEVEVR